MTEHRTMPMICWTRFGRVSFLSLLLAFAARLGVVVLR